MNQLYRKKTPFLFVLDYELNDPFIAPLDSISSEEILFSFPGFQNSIHSRRKKKTIQYTFNPPGKEEFMHAFEKVSQEIHAGNTYLLNLCFASEMKINASLREIFEAASAPYKLYFKDRFTCFSPESFVQIKEGRISTFPMKGTLEKTSPDSISELLNDEKEAAEHATITDLLRNDLSRVADDVNVKRYRYIDEIQADTKTILQQSSEISGIIKPSFCDEAGTVFSRLLPAGSVTGAPKKKTLEIISEVENFDRGFFTGVFGFFDGEKLNSAVMIRFIEKTSAGIQYKSGAGITFLSDAEKEYAEVLQKIYVPVFRDHKDRFRAAKTT